MVAASNGGADRPPGWLLNVKAEPAVDVQIGRRRFPAVAAVTGPGDANYDRLWQLVNERNRGRYNKYQSKIGDVASSCSVAADLSAETPLPIPSCRSVRADRAHLTGASVAGKCAVSLSHNVDRSPVPESRLMTLTG